MSQNWDEPPHHDAEKQVFEPGRRHVVRRLHEDIAGIGQRQQVAGPEPANEVGNDVIVGPGDQAQGDAMVVERPLELLCRLADLRAGILVNAREDVGGARDVGHAILDEGPGHGDRYA